MLEVAGLSAFYGDAQALWDVSLTVERAELVCLIGPNGAGKSTVVNAIAGLHAGVRGSIIVDGRDIVGLPAHRVCGLGVAVVPEGRRVFAGMSVRDNLLVGAYRRSARALHRSSLDSVFGLFPRLAERAGQAAGSLSGGEQQMLAIGRALMARPRLLLLDEPSLGLAPVILDEVFDTVRAICADGMGVLVVEQEVERALAVSARGYVLAEGRIVASGPAADLRESDVVRQSVLGV
jgi:branched-chain amino acid transport system ATP-binding protein